MAFGGLMMIVIWGGIILLIVVAVRWLAGMPGMPRPYPREMSPREMLEERFARGEINEDEFEERKRRLLD